MDDRTSIVKEDREATPLAERLPPLSFEPEDPRMTYILLGIALVAALVSFFVLGSHFSSPDAYTHTIESLDHKKDTVMGLVGASTGSSAAITLLPGDVGTPIAEKLMDLGSDFMIVLAAIYLEKYLLTILGFVSFKILVPVSCVCYAISLFVRRNRPFCFFLRQMALKVGVFGIAAVLVVPASVAVSRMIEDTYQSSIDQTIAAAEQASDDAEALAESEAATSEGTAQSTEQQQQTGILETIQQIPQAIQQLPETVTGVSQEAQRSVNNFIEALAVMVVTSCVIPILVLLFFVWLMRVILGIEIEVPRQALMPRSMGKHRPR